jgi:hypothetical protein
MSKTSWNLLLWKLLLLTLSQLLLSEMILSQLSLLKLISVLLVIKVGVKALIVAFNAYLLEKKNFVMGVSSVREENCNSIVNTHDCEQEDKEGTRVIVIHLHESLPIHGYEEQVKAAHDEVDQNGAEMHCRKGRVDHPEVN